MHTNPKSAETFDTFGYTIERGLLLMRPTLQAVPHEIAGGLAGHPVARGEPELADDPARVLFASRPG